MEYLLFYSLLITFIASLLLTVINDEICDAFYMVIDTLTSSLSSITNQARR